MKKNIWIIEDNQEINHLYRDMLSDSYNLQFFSNINDFKHEINSPLPALVIADLNLPDGNFMNIYNEQNWQNLKTTFMVVSASEDISDLRKCFDLGMNEYLIKPFRQSELLVKVEKLIEQHKVNPFNEIINQLVENEILTNKEIKILKYLSECQDNESSRQELTQTLWPKVTVHQKTLDVHLHNLRKKIIEHNIQIECLKNGNYKLYFAK
jgi:DNA-binding response OmpR family regulator